MIYLIQANIGLILFYTFYKLMYARDTFFTSRRSILLVALLAPFIIPFVDIREWLESRDTMAMLSDFYYSAILPEIVIGMPETGEAPLVAPRWLTYIYMTGAITLSMRLLVQAGSIANMIWKSPWETIENVRVKRLENPTGPFSFFNWIFINKETLKEGEINEVLIHEQTHARQVHSIDVMLAELISIVCWINPFAWLLKREIRQNLEYLADRKVVESGIEAKSYQYHLLGLACKPQQVLINNFNISHLKKRIVMMNKKKTSGAGHIKYALFAIPAFVLLIAGNISCSSEAEQKADVKETDVKETTATAKFDTDGVASVKVLDAKDAVFEVVEHMPEFPGGMNKLISFINSNVKYPASAQEKGTQGRVVVQFIVEKDGSATSPKIVKSVDPELDAEALRIVGQMPKWKPGTQRGEAVRVKFTLPVVFRLQ